MMQAEPERMRCFARWLMAAIEKDADAGSAHSTSRPVSAEREPWGTLSGELGGWPFADVIVPHEKPEVKLDGRLIEWRWFLEHLRTGEMDQKIIVIRDPSARQW